MTALRPGIQRSGQVSLITPSFPADLRIQLELEGQAATAGVGGGDLMTMSPMSWTRLTARLLGRVRRGEMTASAMENQLTSLERKIDELLASVDKKEMDGPGPKGNASTDMKGGKGEGI